MTVRSTIAFGITTLLVGCFPLTEPVDSVDVAVSVEPPTFQVGDTATVVVLVRNPTLDTIRFRTDGCWQHFAAYDAAGRQVAPAGLYCMELRVAESLAPGEERRASFIWLGEPWTNRRPQGEPYPSEFLPAGTYTVRGVLPLESGERRSAPVTVRLLPPD